MKFQDKYSTYSKATGFSTIKHNSLECEKWTNIALLPYDRYVRLKIKVSIVKSNAEYG
jgi:hypothetical protein